MVGWNSLKYSEENLLGQRILKMDDIRWSGRHALD